jgi:hypothetical protein
MEYNLARFDLGARVAGNSFFWWSRWDCLSALEENRRKTAKFQVKCHLLTFPMSLRNP